MSIPRRLCADTIRDFARAMWRKKMCRHINRSAVRTVRRLDENGAPYLLSYLA